MIFITICFIAVFQSQLLVCQAGPPPAKPTTKRLAAANLKLQDKTGHDDEVNVRMIVVNNIEDYVTRIGSLAHHIQRIADEIRRRQSPSFRIAAVDNNTQILEGENFENFRNTLNHTMKQIFDIAYAAGRHVHKYVFAKAVDDFGGNAKDVFQKGYETGARNKPDKLSDDPKDFMNVRFKLPGNVRNSFQLAFNLGHMFGKNPPAADLVDSAADDTDPITKFIISLAYEIGAYYKILKDPVDTETLIATIPSFPTTWVQKATKRLSHNAKALFNLGQAAAMQTEKLAPAYVTGLLLALSKTQKYMYKTGYNIAFGSKKIKSE